MTVDFRDTALEKMREQSKDTGGIVTENRVDSMGEPTKKTQRGERPET